MAKYLLTWLVLSGLLLAGMIVPASGQAQIVQVTMGIDGMV